MYTIKINKYKKLDKKKIKKNSKISTHSSLQKTRKKEPQNKTLPISLAPGARGGVLFCLINIIIKFSQKEFNLSYFASFVWSVNFASSFSRWVVGIIVAPSGQDERASEQI